MPTKNIKNDIKEAIESLKKEILEREDQIKLLQSIDFSKTVDESTWHKICETNLRYSNLLAVLLKNTFPLAENISVGRNYVFFEMMGFNIEIPNSRCLGINVDTSWYKKDFGKPTLNYNKRLEKYYAERKEMKEKAEILVHEVLPILDKFSTKHSCYGRGDYTIEEIKKLENI